MINIDEEQPLTLSEVARIPFLKRNGRKPHIATLYRWATGGKRGVQLQTIQIGGTRCTTREALLRFFNQLSRSQPGPVARTRSVRERAKKRAEEELANEGI